MHYCAIFVGWRRRGEIRSIGFHSKTLRSSSDIHARSMQGKSEEWTALATRTTWSVRESKSADLLKFQRPQPGDFHTRIGGFQSVREVGHLAGVTKTSPAIAKTSPTLAIAQSERLLSDFVSSPLNRCPALSHLVVDEVRLERQDADGVIGEKKKRKR